MGSTRVPLLVGVAVIGTTLLTATALGAVTQGGYRVDPVDSAAQVTSSVTRNGVQMKASAASARVVAGTPVPLTVTVRSSLTRTAIVDLSVHGFSPGSVFQRTWPAQTLVGGRTYIWTVTWTTPAEAGRYRIEVEVFTDGWGSLLANNNTAAFVVVAAAGRPARTVPDDGPLPGVTSVTGSPSPTGTPGAGKNRTPATSPTGTSLPGAGVTPAAAPPAGTTPAATTPGNGHGKKKGQIGSPTPADTATPTQDPADPTPSAADGAAAGADQTG